MSRSLLRPLSVVVLACAVAAPLAAAFPDAENVELRILPEEPYDIDDVQLSYHFVVPSLCDLEILVHQGGHVFEIVAGSCPVLPPGPREINETIHLSRLAPGDYEVRFTYDGPLVEAIPFTVREAKGTCKPTAAVLCLGDRRFQAEAAWEANGQQGAGQADTITRDTGRFSFFSPSNVEAVLKVIDGCAANSHFWVFAGGLTNVRTTLTVTDTKTGAIRTYQNPANTAFRPVQDTAAFDCP
jgi:hypothetical protein